MQENLSGKLILILGPSGCGKGTLIKYLKENHPDFSYPASYTTRVKRPNEVEGDVYHYISKDEFKTKIEADEFLEWAIVHQDNYYGTSKKDIIDGLKAGETVVREVDIQGVESITKLLPKENYSTIFIITPTWEELAERIKNRAAISDEELENRRQSYLTEKEFEPKADHVILSETGNIDQAFIDLEQILTQICQ
jgi:guanylate kinase